MVAHKVLNLCIVALSRYIFERHIMYILKDLSFVMVCNDANISSLHYFVNSFMPNGMSLINWISPFLF